MDDTGLLPRRVVDLNCDLGESYGIYRLGKDEELLPYISSANIACGFHAGDPTIMRKTVIRCLEHNVAIGAHPGLPDREGFGRRNIEITPEEAYELTVYQLGALFGIVRAEGGKLSHVKPHGALYNMAAQDRPLADAIARAVLRFDPGLILYGLAGSELLLAGEAAGLVTASEVFPDRRYEADGSLTSRKHADALAETPEEAADRAIGFVRDGLVRSRQGTWIKVKAETLCIHGDKEDAVPIAKAIRSALAREGIEIASPHKEN